MYVCMFIKLTDLWLRLLLVLQCHPSNQTITRRWKLGGHKNSKAAEGEKKREVAREEVIAAHGRVVNIKDLVLTS